MRVVGRRVLRVGRLGGMGRRKGGALLINGSLGVLRRESRLGDLRQRHLMVYAGGVRSSVMAIGGSGDR